jgi:hypothetical protein
MISATKQTALRQSRGELASRFSNNAGAAERSDFDNCDGCAEFWPRNMAGCIAWTLLATLDLARRLLLKLAESV